MVLFQFLSLCQAECVVLHQQGGPAAKCTRAGHLSGCCRRLCDKPKDTEHMQDMQELKADSFELIV